MLPESEIENLSHDELLMEAKQRRKSPTKSETILWKFLRNKNMYGFTFRRQAISKNLIFDFYCHTLKLVIDIDYSVDNLLDAYYKDRDEKLHALGYHVLRFKNDQILDAHRKVVRRIDACVEEIWEMKKKRHNNSNVPSKQANYSSQTHPIPGPSPREGKGTRAAGEMGSAHDEKPIRFDISRETRNQLIEQARHMRQWSTQAEAILWDELRGRKLAGYKFRRQHPIGLFIVDFYCPAHKLVIEIDGLIHERQKENDRIREEYLQALGYKILRFDNQQVMDHLIAVLDEIRTAVTAHKEK